MFRSARRITVTSLFNPTAIRPTTSCGASCKPTCQESNGRTLHLRGDEKRRRLSPPTASIARRFTSTWIILTLSSRCQCVRRPTTPRPIQRVTLAARPNRKRPNLTHQRRCRALTVRSETQKGAKTQDQKGVTETADDEVYTDTDAEAFFKLSPEERQRTTKQMSRAEIEQMWNYRYKGVDQNRVPIPYTAEGRRPTWRCIPKLATSPCASSGNCLFGDPLTSVRMAQLTTSFNQIVDWHYSS